MTEKRKEIRSNMSAAADSKIYARKKSYLSIDHIYWAA